MTNLCVTQGRSLRNCGTNKTAAGNVWFLEDYLQGGLCTEWGGGGTIHEGPWHGTMHWGRGTTPGILRYLSPGCCRPPSRIRRNCLKVYIFVYRLLLVNVLNSRCLALIFDQNYLSISLYRIFLK